MNVTLIDYYEPTMLMSRMLPIRKMYGLCPFKSLTIGIMVVKSERCDFNF